MTQPNATANGNPKTADRRPDAQERLLGRGLIYRFLGTAYRYPDPDAPGAVCRQERATSEALAALADDSDGRLVEHFAELQNAARKSTAGVLEQDYVSVFGHVVRGRCPLYEAEYGESDERLQQPHELSDLGAFYRAFGLKLGNGIGERVDFIGVQCEFMAFLCIKQAYAEEQGQEDLSAVTVDAQRKFLRDHLGRWAPACARSVIDESDSAFYRSLARITLAFLTDECRRVGVTTGKEHLKLRLPLKEADACLSCPMAEKGTAAD